MRRSEYQTTDRMQDTHTHTHTHTRTKHAMARTCTFTYTCTNGRSKILEKGTRQT